MNKSYLFTLILLVSACTQNKSSETDNRPVGRVIEPVSSLTFLSDENIELATIQIAIADEDSERNLGLMDVRTMPNDHGMIFIFEEESPRSFWMANTPLSLDIMYVGADSTIVRIYQNTVPFSETSLPSDYPAKYVVETNAGFAVANGISEGTKISF